jgi:hypothetical protein
MAKRPNQPTTVEETCDPSHSGKLSQRLSGGKAAIEDLLSTARTIYDGRPVTNNLY